MLPGREGHARACSNARGRQTEGEAHQLRLLAHHRRTGRGEAEKDGAARTSERATAKEVTRVAGATGTGDIAISRFGSPSGSGATCHTACCGVGEVVWLTQRQTARALVSIVQFPLWRRRSKEAYATPLSTLK